MTPRLPDNVKRLRGETRPSRMSNQPRPVSGIPNPPSWLDAEAKREWARVAPELHRLGLLSVLDRAILSVYTSAWSTFVAARKRLEETDLVVEGRNRGGGEVKSPAWTVYAQASTLVLTLGRELGLSPAARSRISVREPLDDDPLLD